MELKLAVVHVWIERSRMNLGGKLPFHFDARRVPQWPCRGLARQGCLHLGEGYNGGPGKKRCEPLLPGPQDPWVLS